MLEGDMAGAKTDVGELRRMLDLTDTVVAVKRQIEAPEASDLLMLKRSSTFDC
jgi:hypothetical protein